MSYLLRYSRHLTSNLVSISRSSTTTGLPASGTDVRSSSTSANLSQTPLSTDGTNSAVRDANQPATSKQAQEPETESALNTYSQFGLTIALLIGTYFLYQSYKRRENFSQNVQNAQTSDPIQKQK